MFYYLQHLSEISLLRLFRNGSCIVLMTIMLTIITFKHVEAHDYPDLFPYSTGGLNELKESFDKKTQVFVTFQEIDLGNILKVKDNDVKILGIFQSVGSGIETINAHVYVCEIGKCQLFFFLGTFEREISIELMLETREIVLKSNKGNIILRTSFPHLALFDK